MTQGQSYPVAVRCGSPMLESTVWDDDVGICSSRHTAVMMYRWDMGIEDCRVRWVNGVENDLQTPQWRLFGRGADSD